MNTLRRVIVPRVGRSRILRRILWQSDDFVMWAAQLEPVRSAIVDDPELIERHQLAYSPNHSSPPQSIEVDVTDGEFARMFTHIQSNWEALGTDEPFWSVISADQFRSDNVESDEQALDFFYEAGFTHVRHLIATLERNHIDVDALDSCLELGCGVGRLTAALADRFEHVVGCDISQSHLHHAETYLNRQEISNVELRRVADLASLEALPKVDLVYSMIVLQHNPPPIIDFLLRRLFDCLNPGGVAVFQVPTYFSNYSFVAADYFGAETQSDGKIEMHVIPQERVFDAASDHGCRVLEVFQDHLSGLPPIRLSNTFVVQKRTVTD